MAHNMEKSIKFPQWTRTIFVISPVIELFDMKSMQNPKNKSEKFKLLFRGFLAPLRIMQKPFPDGQGDICFEKFKIFVS